MTTTQRHPRRPSGFTLVEILVVLVILGIISAMVVPAIGSRDDLKTSAACRVLMADLMYAQNLAITTQKFVYVRFDADADTWTLRDSNANTTINTTNPDGILTHPVNGGTYVQALGSNGQSDLAPVQVQSLDIDGTAAQETLGFDALGTPYALVDDASPPVALAGQARISLRAGTATDGYTMSVYVEPYTGEISVANGP